MRAAAILVLTLLAACDSYKLPKAVPPVKGKLRQQYVMRVIEVAPGTGKLYEPGKLIQVHYTAYLRDGTKFDSSRDRDEPFDFKLGAGMVIQGWDQGVAGMKIGGKRKLTIPSNLGYGDRGYPGVIPPKATLIFEVELLGVR